MSQDVDSGADAPVTPPGWTPAVPPSPTKSRDARVRAIYSRYVDAWTPAWDEQVTSEGYRIWSMLPARGMAVTYPGLADGPVFRWSEPWLST